jgi:hypothetical protein
MSIPIPATRHTTRADPRNDPRLVTHDQPVHLRDAHGALLRVLEGTVWLTHDHSPFDLILEAGESWRIDDDRPALLMPCAPARQARVAIDAAPVAPAGSAARWLASLRARFGLAPAC